MNNLETLEADSESEEKEQQDVALTAILKEIQTSAIQESMQEAFEAKLHQTIWDLKILQGRERVKLTLATIQGLYQIKNNYCIENKLPDSPELQKIIVDINDYLQKLLVELTTKEALMKTNS